MEETVMVPPQNVSPVAKTLEAQLVRSSSLIAYAVAPTPSGCRRSSPAGGRLAEEAIVHLEEAAQANERQAQ
jgi:hypothetical protein